MESRLKDVFELPHHTPSKGELYLSDWKRLHFHCNLCVSFYPILPPLRFLTVSSNVHHIVVLCACACMSAAYLCVSRQRGAKHNYINARVSCIQKSGPLNSQHFNGVSASVIMCIWPNQTSSFFCFSATVSVVITACKGRICLCKYTALTQRFLLMWLHSLSTYNFTCFIVNLFFGLLFPTVWISLSIHHAEQEDCFFNTKEQREE